ncbi:hypothetical protein F5B20DRAFT_585736 [Whalleya microplaca]|nr:hypothetical protein F5B20DRAFT_585736 [Whalleya microplaca]
MDSIPSERDSDTRFIFLVGPTATEFVVHQAVFIRLAQYFETLITGGWSEATTKQAIWSDVEVPVFEGLRRFAYLGDFDVPEPSLIDDSLHNYGKDY